MCRQWISTLRNGLNLGELRSWELFSICLLNNSWYSSGPNKHVHTLIYSQRKSRYHAFSPRHMRWKRNIPPTRLFRTTLLFETIEYVDYVLPSILHTMPGLASHLKREWRPKASVRVGLLCGHTARIHYTYIGWKVLISAQLRLKDLFFFLKNSFELWEQGF